MNDTWYAWQVLEAEGWGNIGLSMGRNHVALIHPDRDVVAGFRTLAVSHGRKENKRVRLVELRVMRVIEEREA